MHYHPISAPPRDERRLPPTIGMALALGVSLLFWGAIALVTTQLF